MAWGSNPDCMASNVLVTPLYHCHQDRNDLERRTHHITTPLSIDLLHDVTEVTDVNDLELMLSYSTSLKLSDLLMMDSLSWCQNHFGQASTHFIKSLQ
ncbi:hypothetical protein TNCV_3980501 [Trichonephila clavipes]|nr:hypothetical protein TNCV_3980501 [Trichonephila clavipes]